VVIAYEHVERENGGGRDDHAALDQGEVAVLDGVDHQLPNAWQAEDHLHHDCPVDHARGLIAGDGDDRQHGVAQRMNEHDRSRAHAFGSRGLHVGG
jgi:hypothetical protein